MLFNYLKTLFRQAMKYKMYFMINVLGLSVAMVSVLLATAFILDEYAYDQFHSKKDYLFRLYKKNVSINDGTERLTTETSGLMGPTIVSDYPEATGFTRLLPWFDETVVTYNEKDVFIEFPVFADSSFFEFFDFELLYGDPEQVLVRPSTIVLSKTLAKDLFGDNNPIGETVIGLHEIPYEVTGVVEDVPVNSHIKYDALISWTTTIPNVGPLPYNFVNNWLGQTILTYLELEPEADYKLLENKLPGMMSTYFPERADSYFLKLQPLKDIYLGSDEITNSARIVEGNSVYIKVFGFTAIFILIIACVNYININTAKATKRAKEIGMRKVLGARKEQLVLQFLGESFFSTLVAAGLALLVADLSLTSFNQLVGKELTSYSLYQAGLLSVFGTTVLIVSLIAGLYPAFVLSSFRPSEILSSTGKSKLTGHIPRQVLTTFQFLIALALIIGTVVVFEQTKFLQTKELGFDKDHILVLNINNSIETQYETFKNQLLAYPDILNASVCQATIGGGTFGTTIIPEGQEEELSISIFRTDANFIETMGIKMALGRSFDPNASSDSSSLIINTTFAKLLAWENPIGKTLKFSAEGPEYPILGVTEDFHFEGLNESKVRPVVLYNYPRNFRNVTLRLSGKNISKTIDFIGSVWGQYESRFPFDYYFADSWFNAKYKKEAQLLDTITVFASISILLACLGLYGLTAFTIEQRTKEIGIRKVLGATVSQLTLLLNKKFVLLLLLAFLMAVPVVYYAMEDWLSGFAYKIEIGVSPFILALVITALITLLTVSGQALKAAMMNPARTLKND
ncbi:MAG: ABC transporter permease [Bacteroidota bacterium]